MKKVKRYPFPDSLDDENLRKIESLFDVRCKTARVHGRLDAVEKLVDKLEKSADGVQE